ncbi:MAG TPA: hypothetical protein DDW84_01085 [Phycisphaerales bacterium]|nr:MAG: hypothetical protein A2Y13_12615 [Planctomycetes bacterium GWC2_45_44]HBG77431.1 hypothetical protein [Phycisphaerales bacterium]HBR20597.1 hypothetical protein [Phycisphaerales bacterium]
MPVKMCFFLTCWPRFAILYSDAGFDANAKYIKDNKLQQPAGWSGWLSFCAQFAIAIPLLQFARLINLLWQDLRVFGQTRKFPNIKLHENDKILQLFAKFCKISSKNFKFHHRFRRFSQIFTDF